MLNRFTGDRLIEALQEQWLVAHDVEAAKALAKCAILKEVAVGEVLMTQDGTDNDVCLVLAGEVAVEINGRGVAVRKAGQHVGEMAMIDTKARRSATVRVKQPAVVARVTEPEFTEIAQRHPVMWRRIALELAQRLRERGNMLRPRNEKPILFIGSSVERLDVARAVQTACQYDDWIVRIWTDGVFGAGCTPIESLVAQLDTLDFGIVVVTPDDLVLSRDQISDAPRDNVVFELGLMMGALGRDRTFMLSSIDEKTTKLPSDLVGVQPLKLTPGKPEDLAPRVGPAVSELRKLVGQRGCR